MKDLSTKNVIVKEEKESSESENESKNSSSDNEENAVDIEPTKTVVYDDVKMKLMKKYSDIVSKKNNFGGTQGSWYTLKFYTMKEISAAKYYLVEMEFSNDDKDPMKQLNRWLKATFIHDVLKCLSTDDKDAKPDLDCRTLAVELASDLRIPSCPPKSASSQGLPQAVAQTRKHQHRQLPTGYRPSLIPPDQTPDRECPQTGGQIQPC